MALLNPPGSLPSEMQAIVRLLLSAQGHAMEKEDLTRLVAPPTLRSHADGGATGAESETMVIARSTGIIQEHKGTVTLNAMVAKAVGKDFASARVRSVLRRLLCQEVGLDEARTSNSGGGDLARAAAWYLLQDPLAPPQRWGGPEGVQELTQRQLSFVDRVLENDTRWGALGRWMSYLGLAVHDHRDVSGRATLQVLVPDPTAAVRDELPEIVTKVGTLQPMAEFLDKLSLVCPVLDGGVYGRVIQEMLIADSLPQPAGVVSRSLSHALFRLNQAGSIKLHDQADAPKVLLAGQGEPVPFSHIERKAA